MNSPTPPTHLPSPILQLIGVSTDENDPNSSTSNTEFHYLPSRSVSIFGGQVIAQAIVSAYATVDSTLDIRSLHATFIDKTDPKQSLTYRVSNLRTGNTVANRLVNVFQHNRIVLVAAVSFHRFEESPTLKYHRTLPTNFPPLEAMTPVQRSDYYQIIFQDGLKENDEVLRRALDFKHLIPDATTLNIRALDILKFKGVAKETPNIPRAAIKQNKAYHATEASLRSSNLFSLAEQAPSAGPKIIYQYMKVNGVLQDKKDHHAAAFALASDAFSSQLPAVVITHKNLSWITSLDHIIYFHKPFNPCEWLAVENTVSVAAGGRGLVEMRYWSMDGELVATAVQEGLFRARKQSKL